MPGCHRFQGPEVIGAHPSLPQVSSQAPEVAPGLGPMAAWWQSWASGVATNPGPSVPVTACDTFGCSNDQAVRAHGLSDFHFFHSPILPMSALAATPRMAGTCSVASAHVKADSQAGFLQGMLIILNSCPHWWSRHVVSVQIPAK